MGQLILHVGPHKTGSTYLQQRMFDHRKALAALGIEYPDIGIYEHNHHDIAELARVDEYAALDELLRPLADSPAETIVLSSENFDRLTAPQVRALLAALPAGRTVRVVSFIRDRTDLLVSSWQEHVKHGGLLSFYEFVGPHLSHPYSSDLMNYGLMLDAYASNLGIDALTIIDYDKAVARGDIFESFSQACGLPQMNAFGENFTINNSLPLWAVELIRALNGKAHHEGKLEYANVREAWVANNETWNFDPAILEELKATIFASSRVFDIRGSFTENALHQVLMQGYESRVWNVGHAAPEACKTHLVPLDSWMMNMQAQEAVALIYALVRQHLA